MTIKVAINGYGRIGRNILRAHYEGGKKHDLAIVAVNDLGSPETNAHLTRYDTAHGKFPGKVEVDGDAMVVNGDRIKVLAQRDPGAAAVGRRSASTSCSSRTGFFTTKEKASAHLKGGAKKVIISAPGGKDVDATVVYGVNHETLKASHTVISQRVVHDQLPRAAGQAAARQDRRRHRPDDDGPRVHERPGADRRLPRGPAPRALGDDEHDPDQDRRRRGGRPRAARAQRQARRLRDPRADDQRVARRPVVHRRARHDRRRGERAS